MKYNYDKSRFELSSGRYISCLSPRFSVDDSLDLYCGHDFLVETSDINYKSVPSPKELGARSKLENNTLVAKWLEENTNTTPLTREERSEIADYFIHLWTLYKNL